MSFKKKKLITEQTLHNIMCYNHNGTVQNSCSKYLTAIQANSANNYSNDNNY